MVKVVKKDGSIAEWNKQKIIDAVNKSNDRVKNESKKITDGQINLIVKYVEKKLTQTKETTTTDLHDLVLSALYLYNRAVHSEYKAYRNYKKRFEKSFRNAAEYSHKIIHSGDKENANKDSTLNSTKQSLISEGIMREFMRQFELKPDWVKAHDEGWIHIHDTSQRFIRQLNCCLFDMGKLLKGGFDMNGSKYIEPKTVATAWAVVGDVTLTASSQQLGGFSIPEVDTVLAPYAEKSYQKHLDYFVSKGIGKEKSESMAEDLTIREIEQGYQGFETKLNSVSNSLG